MHTHPIGLLLAVGTSAFTARLYPMEHEYEAKFPWRRRRRHPGQIDRPRSRQGVLPHAPHPLDCRERLLDGGAWVSLRDEGTRSTHTLKQVIDATTIDGTKEIETEVSDLHATADILRRVGLTEVRYQENCPRKPA